MKETTKDQLGASVAAGDIVLIPAKVIAVAGGEGVNLIVQVLGVDAEGKPLAEAAAPRLDVAGGWCLKRQAESGKRRA